MNTINKSVLSIVLALFASIAIAGASKNIVEIAAGNKDFSTLVSLVQEAGLADALQAEGPFTVFAPTNEAFAALPADTMEALKADKEKLKKVLMYHVVKGKVMSSDVKPGKVPTLEGQDLTISMADGTVMVNSAEVVGTDVEASNGVIHVINQVLVPNMQ
ncbi:MAG: fasciclin domain-containing protein [Legionellaceae bacterium]|nr:fasciclin domain-containing protein [Legionellaceae bacterium]